MLHLPDKYFWRLLRGACYSDDLPAKNCTIEQVSFWPKWSAAGTGNTKYVEPDVFIRFASFDLIIEAKRRDDNQQEKDQWKDQIESYRSQWLVCEDKELYLLALGGIRDERTECVNGVQVCKARWSALLDQILLMGSQPMSDADAVVIRILDDLELALQLHGYLPYKWMSDWCVDRLLLSKRNQTVFLTSFPGWK